MGDLAGRQHGRITTAQLQRLGVTRGTVLNWRAAGYLYPCLPRVYAVGSPARTAESDLFEAILYAGPGAMLSHPSAAHWRGLLTYAPPVIHVSTPCRRRSLPGIVVHGRRQLERGSHLGIPVTTIPQTLVDLAAAGELKLVRRALKTLDFRGELDSDQLWRFCGRAHPGSSALKTAILDYDPLLAHTNGPLEEEWVDICRRTGTPLPDEFDAWIEGIECDAVYYDAKLVIAFDGTDNHRSRAQMRRDRRNDFILRSHGWLVLRYSSDQLRDAADEIAAEVRANLLQRIANGRR